MVYAFAMVTYYCWPIIGRQFDSIIAASTRKSGTTTGLSKDQCWKQLSVSLTYVMLHFR